MMRGKQRKMRQLVLLLLAGLLLLALGSLALAQSGLLQITWWTVDGGGGTSGDGMYMVSGSAGQAEAGGVSGDGHYTVRTGFWSAAAPPVESRGTLFLPVVRRQ
jgi:ABC-type glycerol-3-phosphate transport system substrate-binding protein